MVTNIRGIICSFLALAMLCGHVSDAQAANKKKGSKFKRIGRSIKKPFIRINTVDKLMKNIAEDAEENAEEYYKKKHKKEIDDLIANNNIAIAKALKSLDENARKDVLWIFDYSDKELCWDSIINLCCEFKLIEKKLELLNKIQTGLLSETLTDLKDELSEEIKDAYSVGFLGGSSLLYRFSNAYSKITGDFSQINNFNRETDVKDMYSTVKKLNTYLGSFMKNMIGNLKKANEELLTSFMYARAEEEVKSFNENEGFKNGNRMERSLANEVLRRIGDDHITAMKATKIDKILVTL